MIPPAGPLNARIMIVGEAPGAEEERLRQPFVGASGNELTKMLAEAGIQRSECFLTNVARVRPAGNDITKFVPARKADITHHHVIWRGRHVTKEIIDGVELLAKEISLVRPNLIIALGNIALWALTGEWGIMDWRGSELSSNLDRAPRTNVIPTIHPTAILRQWSLRLAVVTDLKRAKRYSFAPEYPSNPYNLFVARDISSALEFLDGLITRADAGPIVVSTDIETRGGHIACIGFGTSRHHAVCIPLMCVENLDGFWPLEYEVLITRRILRIITHPGITHVGQNFIYDSQYFWRHWHCVPTKVWDTMLAQHCCFPQLPKALDYIASLNCERYRFWKNDGKNWDPSVGESQLWIYNAEDCARTFECRESLERTICDLGLERQFTFQMNMWHRVLRMMNRGIRIDENERQRLTTELVNAERAQNTRLEYIIGHPINIRSPKQMADFFYRELAQPEIHSHFSKGGGITTNDEALEKIALREPILGPIIHIIQELRSISVFTGTFLKSLVDVFDGRVRCSFNVGGTVSFRFSSSESAFGSGTNLQNIPGAPKGSSRMPNLRTMFVPDPDYTVFDLDLSSADLYFVTWESDCRELKQMFAAGLKPYVELMKEYYHDPSITKSHPMYNSFKSFCHGSNYLGKARNVAGRVGLDPREGERLQQWYFRRFPEIVEWQNRVVSSLHSTRTITNVWGNKNIYFDRLEGTTINEAVAWIGQSSTALLINRIFAAIEDSLPECQILLQVHDSLVGQFPSGTPGIIERIRAAASVPVPYPDPLIIPVGIKKSEKSWGACE